MNIGTFELLSHVSVYDPEYIRNVFAISEQAFGLIKQNNP